MPQKLIPCYQIPFEMEYMFSLALGTPPKELPDFFDWDSFFAFTEKNRLETLVAAGAAKLPQPQPRLKRLSNDSRALSFKTFRQIQVLAFLAQDFRAANIPMLSLKGPLLAAEIYGDPSLRHSNDLDLLVRESDYERAKARLLAIGFTEYIPKNQQSETGRKIHVELGEDMHTIFLKDDLCVELHWRISFRYAVSFEELWHNRQSRQLLGQEVFCLGKTDNLNYLITHAAGHGFSRLRWLTDLYTLLTRSGMNFTELYKAMEEKSTETYLLETLLLLYRFPAFRMPAISNQYFTISREENEVHFIFDGTVYTAATRAIHLTDLLEPLLMKPTDPYGFPERNYMHMLPIVGKRATIFTYLYRLMQPKQAELERFHFPDSLHFLYYIVRPFYKLWRISPFYKGPYK